MTNMRTHSRYLLAVAVLAVAIAASAASAASPVKITNCNKAVSRPKQMTLTCADANTGLSKLKWSSFGGTSAKGSGTFYTNTCEPNCASGKTVRYPVTVAASAPRGCKAGLRVYGKLQLKFTGKVPSSVASQKNWALRCPY
jgi:hypothetical protein